MPAPLNKLLAAVVLMAAVGSGAACCCGCAGASAGCDGVSGEADTVAPEAVETTDDVADAGDVVDAGETDETPEPAGEPTCMLDVFRRLEVGDWVRTRWTNKETHTLLVAARTDDQITIEEIVEDRGFRKAWTQLDVSLDDGSLLALRERLAYGTIEAREPSAESQRGTSDLLLERFRPDCRDEVEIRRIDIYADGEKQGEKRGLFLCRRYRITVEEKRYAHLWFSRIKLPDYPVKIHYYEENLTIKLEAFGTGRASEFTTKPEPRRHHGTESQ
jgi:hypothetical protein